MTAALARGALRLSLAALILCIVMRPWRARPNFVAWRSLLGYGLSLGAMNLLFYMSLKTIPLGIAVALEFTGPLALALFGSRRLLDFVWIALAALGLWLLLPDTSANDHLDPLGMALALGAGLQCRHRAFHQKGLRMRSAAGACDLVLWHRFLARLQPFLQAGLGVELSL